MATLIFTMLDKEAAVKAALRNTDRVYVVARFRVEEPDAPDTEEPVHVIVTKAEAMRLLTHYGCDRAIRWYQYDGMIIIDQSNPE